MAFAVDKKRVGESAYAGAGRPTASFLQSGDMRGEFSGLGNTLHFQPGNHHEGFMRPVFTVPPAFGDGGIEEFPQHPIRIHRFISHFEEASPLKFGETLQFATGETSQEV